MDFRQVLTALGRRGVGSDPPARRAACRPSRGDGPVTRQRGGGLRVRALALWRVRARGRRREPHTVRLLQEFRQCVSACEPRCVWVSGIGV